MVSTLETVVGGCGWGVAAVVVSAAAGSVFVAVVSGGVTLADSFGLATDGVDLDEFFVPVDEVVIGVAVADESGTAGFGTVGADAVVVVAAVVDEATGGVGVGVDDGVVAADVADEGAGAGLES